MRAIAAFIAGSALVFLVETIAKKFLSLFDNTLIGVFVWLSVLMIIAYFWDRHDARKAQRDRAPSAHALPDPRIRRRWGADLP